MRIRVYMLDEQAGEIGVRYDEEKRFAPMTQLQTPDIFAACREGYSYEGCRNFGRFKVISDVEFNEEEE